MQAPRAYSSDGQGSGVAIAEDMYFSSVVFRDAWTTSNPNRLYQGVVCAVGDEISGFEFYMWDSSSSTWVTSDVILQGPKGDKGIQGLTGDHVNSAAFSGNDIVFGDTGGRQFPLANAVATLTGPSGDAAPNPIYQYSGSVSGPWIDIDTFNQNPDLYQFWRVSPDNGNTFTSPVRFRASVQDLPDGWGWFPSGDGGLQLKKDGLSILDISLDELKSKRFNIINSLLKFGASKSMYDAGENVSFVNRTSGISYAPAWQDTAFGSSYWQVSSRENLGDHVRENYQSGFVTADTGNTVPNQLSFTPETDRRVFAFYTNLPSAVDDATVTISTGGKTFMVVEGLTIGVGEQRTEFKSGIDDQPFVDMRSGVTYTVTISNAAGSPVTSYAMTGNPLTPWFALDFTEFSDRALVSESMIGDGLEWDSVKRSVNISAGSNTDIGGFIVGTGLAVDGSGRLYSTVSGSIVTAVDSEAARLGLPKIAQSYTCIQTDVDQVFYLDANDDPDKAENWLAGGSTIASVIGFQGKGDTDPRTGVIVSQRGDYTSDEITVTDKTNGTKYIQVLDNGVMYLEEI